MEHGQTHRGMEPIKQMLGIQAQTNGIFILLKIDDLLQIHTQELDRIIMRKYWLKQNAWQIYAMFQQEYLISVDDPKRRW